MPLIQGRGTFKGEDAGVETLSWLNSRARDKPDQETIFHTSIPPIALVTYSANTFAIGPIVPPPTKIVVSRMKLNVTTISAGNTIGVALYRFETRRAPHINLKMIAGSQVKFSTAATGLISQDLLQTFTLYPDQTYYMGVQINNAIAATAGANMNRYGVRLHSLTYNAAHDFPSQALIGSKTIGTSLVSMPSVAFVSKFAQDYI